MYRLNFPLGSDDMGSFIWDVDKRDVDRSVVSSDSSLGYHSSESMYIVRNS